MTSSARSPLDAVLVRFEEEEEETMSEAKQKGSSTRLPA